MPLSRLQDPHFTVGSATHCRTPRTGEPELRPNNRPLPPEIIEKYRKLVREADQATRGADISYTRRLADGSHINVNMRGATPEQVAIIQWLQAEEAWKEHQKYKARELQIELEKQRKRQETLDRWEKQIKDHEELLAKTPPSFRRDMLIRHEPTRPYPNTFHRTHLECGTCMSTDYEPDYLSWPCNEYVFTVDWKSDTPETPDADEVEVDA